MRILVTTNAAIGHLLPMAATVRALAAEGHEVRIGCPESFAPFVRTVGFDPLGCAEIDVVDTVAPPAAEADHHARLMWAVTRSWPSDCRTWLDALLRDARQWRPEVVIVEPVEHAGRIVAASLGVPLIVHGWGFTLPADVEKLARVGIADLYERESAEPPMPALVIDLGPASVQAADAGPARRYGYRPFSVPRHPPPPPRTARPRVLVTLGTYANDRAAAVIRTTVAAALANDADVVAVLGNDDRGSTETFPAGATAMKWVDMPAAVATCDLVVHHGGAGTSWTALSNAKPALVLPQAGDQFRNAALLEAAGAAQFSSSDADLTAAIAAALGHRELSRRAAIIAADNAAMPDVSELAREITALGK